MKSILLSIEILKKYNKMVHKLMKRTIIKGHMWRLNLWEKNGKATKKLYFMKQNLWEFNWG
jgi:hypothetical protein